MNKIFHISSINYEEGGYALDLDLLSILYEVCVSHHRRSGLVT
jgi:hypothetical protein